jgi:hypothetical protein
MRFEASLDKDASMDAWIAAIRRQGLRRAEAPQSAEFGMLGLLGDTSDLADGEYRLNLMDLEQEGGWIKPIAKDLFEPRVEALHRCTKTDEVFGDWWVQPFVIEVDSAGKITRCESKYQYRLDPPEFGCRCDIIRGIDFGPGPEGRRAEFNLKTYLGGEPPINQSSEFAAWSSATFESNDRSALLGPGPVNSDNVKRCVAPMKAAFEKEIPVTFSVGADGAPVFRRVARPDGFPEEVGRCIDDALGKARFTCPLSGKAEIDGTLTITVKKIR